MIDTEFLRQLDRFNLVLKKRVSSQYSGSRESQSFGHGLVFKDYREYLPGDDFRAIDWHVYARTEKFFIKRFEEERNLVLHIVVDASRSMDYGNPNKFEYASKIGVGFAYMALKNQEKFEFSTFSNELKVFKPKAGTNKLVNLVDYLSKLKTTGYSNFSKSLHAYRNLIKSKSMIVIISDFLYPLDEIKETLFRFKKSQVIVIQVLDANEKNLDFEGNVVLADSESMFKMKTYVSKRLRKDYNDKLYDHIYRIKDVCDDINASFISVTTNVPVFDMFYHILGRAA